MLPITAFQTYRVSSPVQTHTKPAHCRDVGCAAYLTGWTFTTAAGSDDERFFRSACAGRVDGYRRPFTVTRDAGFVTFHFEPGIVCRFVTKHRASLHRPENYLLRGGDLRGSTGLIRRYDRPDQWVDDFQGHLDVVARQSGAGR